jgi:hypothetical protein
MEQALHPRSSRVVLAARLVASAWCVLAVLIAWLVASQFPPLRGAWFLEGAVFMGILFALFSLAIAYGCLALTLRCQSCGKRFFVEFPSKRHPGARRVWGMDHWATAVMDVLRRGECTCMGCGQPVRVR